MHLLAADQTERNQPPRRPDQHHSRRLVGNQSARGKGGQCGAAPPPGPGKDRQQRHEEPDRTVMGKRVHHPPGTLPPQHIRAVFGPAQHQCRTQPQADQRQRHQNGKANATIPRPGSGACRAVRPERIEKSCRQHMHQDHRALGIDAQGQRRAKAQRGHQARRPAHRDQGQHRRQRRRGQHRVEHGGRAIGQIDQAAGQDQRRQSRTVGAVGPEPARQNRGQPDAGQTKGRGHQPRANLGDAGDGPDHIHQPEQQRRLLGVKVAVQMRHQF